jgi:hypothetical protein
MSSPFHPIRKRRPRNPVDAMFDQWESNQRRGQKEPPTLSQLHLMALLFMRM